MLDGRGEVTLDLTTSGPGSDLSSTVTEAVLYFDGTIPEPSALALLAVGALAARRRAR